MLLQILDLAKKNFTRVLDIDFELINHGGSKTDGA